MTTRPADLEQLIADSLAHTRAGEISAGLQKSQLAFAQAQATHQPRWAVAALLAQGEACFRLGRYAEAASLASRSLPWADPCWYPLTSSSTAHALQAEAHLLLGRCAAETDDLSAAEDHLRQAIELSRLSGSDRLLVRGLHNLSAAVYTPRAQYALALAADQEVLHLARQKDMPDLVWAPLTTLSWVCCLSGQVHQAAAWLQELQAAVLPASLGEGWFHCIQAHLHLAAGRPDQAAAGFARTRSIGEASGSPELNFYARLGLARLSRQAGAAPAALSWAQDAAAVAARVGYRHIQGMAQVECARCAWDCADLPAAESHFQAAIDLLVPLQARLELAQAHLGLAALLHTRGRPEAGLVTFQALELVQTAGLHFLLDQERALAYPLVAAALAAPDPALAGLAAGLLETLQCTPPPPLRVVTFGGLQVWQGARRIDRRALARRRANELFALLLLSPGQRLGLEEAAERLFPERSPEVAQDLLHKASSALRRALEPELPNRFPSRYLRVEDGLATLVASWSPDLSAWVDFAAFEAACRAARWDDALALYPGEFLPESAYAAWSAVPRQHYATLYQQALLAAARARFAVHDYPAALAVCRRLLGLEPWQEQAVLLGMRAALQLDDRAAARRLYRALEKSLREDLGVAPHTELQALYRSL